MTKCHRQTGKVVSARRVVGGWRIDGVNGIASTRRRADLARAEGIVLTPRGEPLFARDWPRWRELSDVETRTDAEIAEDDAADTGAASDDFAALELA